MITVVPASPDNQAQADLLREVLNGLNETGTLYIGLPVLASDDGSRFVDAIYISQQRGVVAFDFYKAADNPSTDDLERQQSDLYFDVVSKLQSNKALTRRFELLAKPVVITFGYLEPANFKDSVAVVATPETLKDVLDELSKPLEEDIVKLVDSTVQALAHIRPLNRRANVTREDSRGGILKKIEKEIAHLDHFQKKAAIQFPDGPQRIRGLAGSGKTIVLALKAALLSTRYPDWTIGVTFFTRSLYQQFRTLINRFHLDFAKEEFNPEKIRILHGWGTERSPGIYSETAMKCGISPRDVSYARKFNSEDPFQFVCTEVIQNWPEGGIEPTFDMLLIDEAQDFPREFFELAYETVKSEKRIVWAYDELQSLSGGTMAPPTHLFGLDGDGHPRVELVRPDQDIILPRCYRNSHWALACAHALGFGIYRGADTLVQYFDNDQVWLDVGYELRHGSLQPGEEVVLHRSREATPAYFEDLLRHDDAIVTRTFASVQEQAEWVAGEILTNLSKDELEHTDILVIFPNPRTVEAEAKRLRDVLADLGVPSHIVGVTSSRDEMFMRNSIAISGIRRAKGNEAAMVYVLDAQFCYQGRELIKLRNILFTAVTRSRAWVRLCGVGDAMAGLVKEVDEVRHRNFELAFRIPTISEREQMNRLNRELSAPERVIIESSEQAMATLLDGLRSGVMQAEDLSTEQREELLRFLTKGNGR